MRLGPGLLCLPLVLLYGVALAALTTLLDLLATPLVLWFRRAAPALDEPPPTRNASVIVLSYNGREFLAGLLPTLEEAVRAAPGQHEILVVDNGSSDGSAAMVAERHPGVRLVQLPRNRFFIRGNRAGVAQARGDILVFVNNDMRVEPGFLTHLLAPFGRGDVFAVTARIEMAGERVETGRTRGEFRRGAFHLVQAAAPAAADGAADGAGAPPVPALWAGGGSSAFDRRKYAGLGGFETLYDPCYVEDISLSYQAWRRGWRVLHAPMAVVHHAYQGTSSVVLGRDAVRRLDARNRELFFWRSVTDPRMVWAHALYLPWNLLKAAARVPLRAQLWALLAALPRLPRAWWARQRSRAWSRRSDRDVLRLANSVALQRRELDWRPRLRLTVLSVGSEPAPALDYSQLADVGVLDASVELAARAEPPAEDVLGLVPQRFWGTVGDAAASDRLRDLLRETDFDVVVFRDPWVLAASPPGLEGDAAILAFPPLDEPEGLLECWREGRFLQRLLRRVQLVACAREADAQRLRALAPDLPCRVANLGDAEVLGELCRLVTSARPGEARRGQAELG